MHVNVVPKKVIDNADYIIISGSPACVYQYQPWMEHLSGAIEFILSQKKTTLAICFGAQFVAQFLGASVRKNPQGLEFGSVKVHLTTDGQNHPVVGGLVHQQYVHATHTDSIESLPIGASLLAFNDNSAIQAYQYQSIIATQFHPDVPVQTMQKLLDSRRALYLSSGFIRDESHFQDLYLNLQRGSQGHSILKNFLKH